MGSCVPQPAFYSIESLFCGWKPGSHSNRLHFKKPVTFGGGLFNLSVLYRFIVMFYERQKIMTSPGFWKYTSASFKPLEFQWKICFSFSLSHWFLWRHRLKTQAGHHARLILNVTCMMPTAMHTRTALSAAKLMDRRIQDISALLRANVSGTFKLTAQSLAAVLCKLQMYTETWSGAGKTSTTVALECNKKPDGLVLIF